MLQRTPGVFKKMQGSSCSSVWELLRDLPAKLDYEEAVGILFL